MNRPKIEIKNISKYYGSRVALQDVNLNLQKGNVYGLFGRNGAGKTTLLNLISSRIMPDSGNMLIDGRDWRHEPGVITKNICYIPENNYFPPRLKLGKLMALANISYPNFDNTYARHLCSVFNLDLSAHCGQLSRGYQSLIRIIIGLASEAPVTLFDEPALGLDAAARDRFYAEIIEEFSRNPRLFIIATHFIEESADLLNEAIIIEAGKILRQAPVEELLSGFFYVAGSHARVSEFLDSRDIVSSHTMGSFTTAVVIGDIREEKPVSGLRFSSLTIQKLFVYLTNGNIEQERN